MKLGAYFSKKEDLLFAVFESWDVKPGEVAAAVVGIFDGLTLKPGSSHVSRPRRPPWSLPST